jgi:hypothetical protein
LSFSSIENKESCLLLPSTNPPTFQEFNQEATPRDFPNSNSRKSCFSRLIGAPYDATAEFVRQYPRQVHPHRLAQIVS